MVVSIEGGEASSGSRIRGRIRFSKELRQGPVRLELQAAEWAKARKHQRNSIRGRVRQEIERPLGEQSFEFSVPDDFPMPFEAVYSWLRWQVAVIPPRKGLRRQAFVFQIPIE